MKVQIRFNYADLQHLAPLFQELFQRWPHGCVHFVGEPDEHCILDVQPYRITPEDREFFWGLKEKHLIRSWFHDQSE
jgi:hypothetical protein